MPPTAPVTPRDLFLSRDLTEAEAHRYLAAHGFRDPAAADELLQQLADDLPVRLALGELADLLIETLTEAADPDAAVAGFCRYVANRFPKSSFIGYLQDDPRTLQILTALLGASPLLGDILIRNPEHLHWLHRELDCPPPDLSDYRAESKQLLAQDADAGHRLDALKRFQRRETLRIAGRELLDKDTLRSTTEQLSDLADVVIDGALRAARDPLEASGGGRAAGSFAVIGMGRLGGRELSFSRELDLFCVYEAHDGGGGAAGDHFRALASALHTNLTQQTGAGALYRIGGGLRPAGEPGADAGSLQESLQHCEKLAQQTGRFALIKLRPVAGDLALGQRFVERVRPLVYRAGQDPAALAELVRGALRGARERAGPRAERNVRSGPGGSREVELTVQALQLLHGRRHADLQDASTLRALAGLQALGLVDDTRGSALADAYRFLRSMEHRLQTGTDTAAPVLPAADEEIDIAARRMGLNEAADLEAALAGHQYRVRTGCAYLLERAGAGA